MSDFESGAFNRALPPLRIVFNYLLAAILVQRPKRVQPSKSLSRCEPRRYIPGIHNGTKFCHGWVKVTARLLRASHAPTSSTSAPDCRSHPSDRSRRCGGQSTAPDPWASPSRCGRHQRIGSSFRMSARRVGVAVGFCLVLSGADRT